MTKAELIKMIEEQKETINKLSSCPIWGCLTRAALESRWIEFSKNAVSVVYCDIDDMHGLNKLYEHKGTDSRISKALIKIRHDDVIASRWLNGDELVFILKSGNGKNFASRMMKEFNKLGIKATFSHSQVITNSASETINPLDSKVQESKNNGIRGIILD